MRARITTRPRPVRYMSRMPSTPSTNPPVGKSGPGMWRIRSSTLQSGSMASCRTPAATSRRLWGGTFVLMPTAMPLEPFTSRLGNFAGSASGSARWPSKLGPNSTVSFSMSASSSVEIAARRASV